MTGNLKYYLEQLDLTKAPVDSTAAKWIKDSQLDQVELTRCTVFGKTFRWLRPETNQKSICFLFKLSPPLSGSASYFGGQERDQTPAEGETQFYFGRFGFRVRAKSRQTDPVEESVLKNTLNFIQFILFQGIYITFLDSFIIFQGFCKILFIYFL